MSAGTSSQSECVIRLRIPGAGAAALRQMAVSGFTGEEAISSPFRFVVDVITDINTEPNGISLTELLQQPAALELERGGSATKVSGIVVSAAHLGGDADYRQSYRFELAPKLWLCSLNRHSRTFAQKSAVDVVHAIAAEHGLVLGDVAAAAHVAPQLLQHQESDLEFMARQIANEGMYYYFKPADGGDKLCVGNSNNAHSGAIDLGMSSSLAAAKPGRSGDVFSLQCREQVVAHEVLVHDYNQADPTRPSAARQALSAALPEAKAKAFSSSGTAVVAFQDASPGFPPGSAADVAQAKALAEGLAARQKVFSGTSDSMALRPGGCVRIAGHPVDACNTEYVVTAVRHRYAPPPTGTADRRPVYRNEFSAILFRGPAFRPVAGEPRPQVPGVRLGIVTRNNVQDDLLGDTAKNAVYGVKFPLEQDDQGQAIEQLARLATPSAGPERGFHFPLEVGDEVVVTHHHGDPSRPLIIGALFHQTSAVGPVVATKDDKVQSRALRSRSGHELRMDDSDDKPFFSLVSGKGHALAGADKDGESTLTLSSGVKKHTLLLDDGNEAVILSSGGSKHHLRLDDKGKSIELLSGGGKFKLLMDDDAGKLEIVCGQASIVLEKSGKITIKGDGAIAVESGAGMSLKAGADLKAESATATAIKAGTDLKAEGGTAATVKAGTQLALQGGTTAELKAGASLSLDGGGMTEVKGGMVKIN